MTFLPSVTQLAEAVGCTHAAAELWAPVIRESCAAYDITGPYRLPAYLAQIGHESAGLARLVENLNYSAQALRKTWPSRFTAEQARDYSRQPQRIAARAYADRMGNGPESSGEGWKYRGRGVLQVTGKANYEAVRDLLRERRDDVPDFVAEPDRLAEPQWAAWSAAALWHEWACNGLADYRQFRAITRKINGGLNGYTDRLARLEQASRALA